MATKLLDTSFWSHALIPSQRTEEATAALHDLIVDDDEILVTPPVMVEFHSLLRKLTLRGTMTSADATTALADMAAYQPRVEWQSGAAVEGFELAVRLGQSDTFDATGYVIAQRYGAEFWVSDVRFANAAAAAGLTGIRVIA